MKDTLEYKILKYLTDTSKVSFVSLDQFTEDKYILKLKLKTLIKDGFIDIKRTRTGEYSTKAEYMININGLIYLNTLESKENKNITNNFNNSTIGQFNQSDDLNVLKTEIKQTIQPKEKQQIAFILFIAKFWWQILIPLILGIVLIVIEKNWQIINIF
jgi:hypothetical protein